MKKLQKSLEDRKKAMKHSNKLGAGAKKRKKLHNPDDKFQVVMDEWKRGTLHSGSGEIVTDYDQAVAIAMSVSGKSNKKKKVKKSGMMGKLAKAIEEREDSDVVEEEKQNFDVYKNEKDIYRPYTIVANGNVYQLCDYSEEPVVESSPGADVVVNKKPKLDLLGKLVKLTDDGLLVYSIENHKYPIGYKVKNVPEVITTLVAKESVKKSLSEMISERILKAKYLKKYRDKSGKWRYDYYTKKGKKSSSKEERVL